MTIEEVRAHAAAWMAKQDPAKNLPDANDDADRDERRYAEPLGIPDGPGKSVRSAP